MIVNKQHILISKTNDTAESIEYNFIFISFYKDGIHCNKISLRVRRVASSFQMTWVLDPSNSILASSRGCGLKKNYQI